MSLHTDCFVLYEIIWFIACIDINNPEYGLKDLRERTGPLQPQHINTIDIPEAPSDDSSMQTMFVAGFTTK